MHLNLLCTHYTFFFRHIMATPGSTVKTRANVSCTLFGAPSALPKNRLPTNGDVMKFYKLTQRNLKGPSNKMHAQRNIAKIVVVGVNRIWEKSLLPRVTHQRINQMVKEYYNKYIAMLRVPKTRHDYPLSIKGWLQLFWQIPTNGLT